MIRKTKWTVFFTLLAALLLAVLAGAAEEEAAPELPLRAVILYEEDARAEQMEALLAGTEGVTLLCRYETFFTGAAVEADAKTLAALARLDGVSGVGLAEYYECASSSTLQDSFTSEECLAMMNADKLWKQGYTGDGTVIAVLDSGCNVGHEVFADASLMKSPALSKTAVAAFTAKGGTKGAYISTRIPFAYDYYSRDTDVSTTVDHGTHVTALAAGYARSQNGGTAFRGAAPGAQILAMKIFPDGSSGGTDDTVILRALEDAWNLGADVVNLSVGTGAGFSGSDTMNGLYCRAYTQMAESGVIICCAAGNSGANVSAKTWGKPLPTGSYTDYGSVCSPGSLYGVLGIAAASRNRSGSLTVADYSSWGPASNLHLDPALTAFGGPVAAAAGKNNQYKNDAGTSMASPYAAGSMAVLLQSIRARGVTDRRQSSDLVQQMVESHTQLLKDSASGLPLSPRRQGAGLIDVNAALYGSLVVATPLIELGESKTGQFTAPVTLRNISSQPMQVTLGIQVLTDDYTVQNGVSYSRMAPRDITSGVTATVSGSRTITVPAQGTAKVVLNLSVTAKLKEELARIYPNGFYVEGYITAAAGGGETAHGAFLGYCGDWNAAPVLDPTDFRDVQNAAYRLEGGTAVSADRNAMPEDWDRYLSALGANLGANLPFLAADRSMRPENGAILGFNGHANVPPNDARNAIPSRDTTAMTTAGGALCLDVYTQRNAAGAVMLVSDQKTGEVYYAEKKLLLKKSDEGPSGTINAAHTFAWDGADAHEKPLSAGTKVRVDIYAWLDTDEAMAAAYSSHARGTAPSSYAWMLKPEYDEYRELSFPVTLDGAPPTAEASLDGTTLKLTIRDDQYTSYASILSAGGRTLASKTYAPKEPGETCTLAARFSSGTLPEKVYIRLEDYATNTTCYELDLQALSKGKTAALTPCAMALFTDVAPDDWYHEAVDYVVEHRIMGGAEDGMAFYPDTGATRWEIVSTLYRANGSPETNLDADDLPFHDIPEYARYITELCWAYEKGVVSGSGYGAFFGTASVTRQELAVMLYRCAKLNGKDKASGKLAGFPDAGSVADWAKDAMGWAVGAGLIRGNASGKLAPQDGVSRAETAQILMRFMEMK